MDVSLSIATVMNLCFIMMPAFTFASINPRPTIPSTTASTGIPFQICDSSASFQNNSVFQQNLNIVLNALLSDTPTPSKLFKVHVQGTDPDKVYGYNQCFFTSLSGADCSLCIQRAVNQTSVLCPNAIGAQIIYDECRVSYGTKDISSDMVIILVNVNKYSADSPFQHNLNKVWRRLREKAPLSADPVAFASGNSSDLAYGFAQCENLLKSDCAGRFKSGMSAVGLALGARVIYLNSFYRYENYDFFTGGVPFQIVDSAHPSVGLLEIAASSTQRSQIRSPGTQILQPRLPEHVSIPDILATVSGGAALLAVCIILVIYVRNITRQLLGFSEEGNPTKMANVAEGL
ncbi:hypothetical protein O6H91_03G044900 [Diphasiastrum complanatum]|uniref:Uncharacterized protein n=1 Tax=Diphasiastrum complanatum TaxID=34168 RepID=A0ACC2E5R6_DIPCM|nr:hypothetical protein O6H91_03G044900 [Diphasiastrum complanatum]